MRHRLRDPLNRLGVAGPGHAVTVEACKVSHGQVTHAKRNRREQYQS